MDRSAFDAFTRRLAAPGSRRAMLGVLAGALLATPTVATARRRHRRARPDHPGNGDNPPGHGSTPPGHGGTPPGSGGGSCAQKKLFGLCIAGSVFEDEPCCNGMTCTSTINPFIWACQKYCTADADCQQAFPNKALVCRTDALVCPLEAIFGGKCCVPR